MFIIHREKDNTYLMLKGAEFKGWTENVDSAHKFTTESRAKNLLNSTFKKRFAEIMDELSVIPYGATTSAPVEPIESDEEAAEKLNDVKEIFNALSATMNDIPTLKDYYVKQLSYYDLAQEDILHKIEFGNVTGIMAVRLCKQLKEIRQKRREIKDNIAFLQTIITNGAKNLSVNVDKYYQNLETRTYTPRVLTELFK